ncbi:hypothetical protein [Vibrio hyugaensis]|uniref:hypothetical protein n=1 Tax=Vibrio hyugaensis TaxID=1534743 RepID=UPI000CE2C50F|nr:hypothetical protein [Vibrio hyugaensis]
MNNIVLVFGGLGNAKSSVVGLYENLLHTLSSRFDVVAIDPAVHEPCESKLASQFQFPYSARYADLDAFLQAHRQSQVAAVFVLTPVGTHLSIIEQVSGALDIQNLLFVVEKPSFSLAEIDKGFNQVIPQLKRRGAQFYFIDTALVSPSLEALFTDSSIALPDSAPRKIIAIAADNPIDSHETLQDFRFENRIELLSARKLLNLATSGGGGYGFDMGIHAIAGLVRYLHKSGIEDSQVELKHVRAERINESQLEYTQGAETHLYVEGELKSPEGKIEVVIEAGKAGDIWDRRLELHYPERVIAIGFGTLKHPPYLWEKSPDGIKNTAFDVSDSGYTMHFNDILCALGFDAEPLLSQQESEALMSQSMNLLSSVFDAIGDTHQVREQNITVVDAHTPKYLSEAERVVRAELSQYLDNLII